MAIDRDEQALAMARHRLAECSPVVTYRHGNFHQLPDLLRDGSIETVDGLLVDLGVSSLQLEEPARGFSFLQAGPLDMRMDVHEGPTAASLVARLSAVDLEYLFRTYGQERWARRIAKRIVEARAQAPIRTTTDLAHLIVEAVPPAARHGRLHPATRTFQALRIAVNKELEALQALLDVLPTILSAGGRAAFIAFHSLEDRAVKRAFQESARSGLFRLLTKKPIRPSEQEVADNPRSRSAKLRVAERL